jgi:phage-related protein
LRWVYYKEASGRVPAKEFVDAQPPELREKLFMNLERLARFGAGLGDPFVSDLGDVSGLTTTRGSEACVTMFFCRTAESFVFLHGSQSGGAEDPNQALEVAESRMRDYFRRSVP